MGSHPGPNDARRPPPECTTSRSRAGPPLADAGDVVRRVSRPRSSGPLDRAPEDRAPVLVAQETEVSVVLEWSGKNLLLLRGERVTREDSGALTPCDGAPQARTPMG